MSPVETIFAGIGIAVLVYFFAVGLFIVLRALSRTFSHIVKDW